jgi:hypothetical protein
MQLFIQHPFLFPALLTFSIRLQSVVALISASSLFYIPPFPRAGNCVGYDLDAIVTDGSILASNAANAIQILLADHVPQTSQNVILAKTAYLLWAAESSASSPAGTITITPAGKAILRQAACKL